MTSEGRGEWRGSGKVLVGCFLGNMLGVHSLPLYGQSVFIAPLEHSFGWSRLQISIGTTIVILVLAVSAPLVGAITDKVRVNHLVGFSAVGMAMGFFSCPG